MLAASWPSFMCFECRYRTNLGDQILKKLNLLCLIPWSLILKSSLISSLVGQLALLQEANIHKKLKRRPSSISMQFENLLEKTVSFKNVSKYNTVMNKRYIVMRKKIDKRNKFIKKMMLFMENIPITFEIFNGRNFHFFPEKGVNSQYKISAKTVFRTFHGNKLLQKGILF